MEVMWTNLANELGYHLVWKKKMIYGNLVICIYMRYIANWYRWPKEIDELPVNNGDFP